MHSQKQVKYSIRLVKIKSACLNFGNIVFFTVSATVKPYGNSQFAFMFHDFGYKASFLIRVRLSQNNSVISFLIFPEPLKLS